MKLPLTSVQNDAANSAVTQMREKLKSESTDQQLEHLPKWEEAGNYIAAIVKSIRKMRDRA